MDGELCLLDGNNALFFISSPSLAVAGKYGKHHAMRSHKTQAVSDWLNPHYLGTSPFVVLLITMKSLDRFESFSFEMVQLDTL